VGDESQQWEEYTGAAYHIRRRLTPKEQKLVGEAIDCRNTEEGIKRYRVIQHKLNPLAKQMAFKELGLEKIL